MHFHTYTSLYDSNMVFEIIERNTKIFVNVSVGGGVRSEKRLITLQ